jgi:putative flippase GtrA
MDLPETGPIARARESGVAAQFLKFAASGAVGTLIQYAILVGLSEGFGVDSVLASAIGFACSAIVNYLLAHRLVFRSSAQHRRALPTFLLVASIGLGLNTAIMYALVEYGGVHYFLSQLAATGIVLCWNFTVNRLWTFRH